MSKINIALLVSLMCLASCGDGDSGTELKPKAVLNASFEPTMGGCIISYDLPDDESISFVRAVYTLKTGQTITRASSYFSNSIEIDGYDDTEEHEVRLYSVNFNGVESDPVVINVVTLGSPLDEIVQTFRVLPYFSSAKFSWENDKGTWIQIVLNIKTHDRTVVQTEYTMDAGENSMWVQNLSSESYSFEGYVIDRYGNESEKVDLGSFVPYVDYKIEKELWSHVPNDELPDGLENADLIFQEGRLSKFYDDVVDDASLSNLNFFVSTKGFPFSYYIDMGRTVKVSRLKVWQREENWAMPHYYYTGQNVRIFEIWISQDKISWEMVRRATILKPSSSTIALEEAKAGHEFVIYEDDPHFTPEFRYLEFRGIESFGMEDQYACLSEITLYGIEEYDF